MFLYRIGMKTSILYKKIPKYITDLITINYRHETMKLMQYYIKT